MNDQQKNNANNSEYIRLADAARFVPYSKDYISLLARQGRIDAKKIGRDWHTTQLAVEEYYRSQEARRSLLNTGRPLGELRQDFVEAGRPMLAVSEEAGDGRPVFEPRWQDLRSSDQIQVAPRSIPTPQPQPVTPIVRASEPAVSAPVATTNSTRSSIGSFGIITRIVVPLAAILVIFGGVRFTPADVVVYGVKDFVALAGEMRKEFVRVVEGGLVAVDEAGNMRVLGNIEAGGQLVSTIMDGIAPLSVRSTTTVPNLSAQYLDGVTKEDIDLAFVVGNGASTAARVALRGGADIASLVVDGTASIATLAVESLTSKEAMIEDARVERADIGQASIAGLSVSGGSTLSDTEIDGTLDVSGTATLRRASVQGRLSVDGTLSVTDSVSAPLFSGGGGNFGNVDIENKLSFTDSATVNLYKKLNVSENVLVTDASFQVGGTLSIAGAFTPATDNTQSIGSSSLRWKDAFLGPEGIKIYNTTGDDAEYATLGYSANVITLTSAADGAGTARNFNITGGNVGIGTTSPDNAVTIDDGSLSFSTAGGASDVVLSRGTSNRLDLADGDSFRIVGGTLQLDLDDTGATQGVVFGSTSDVNLYRSAANTLRTDDSLSVGVQLALPTQGSTGGFVIGTDTNLYRSAADTLYTDDSLVVSAQLQLPASGSSSAGILLGGDVNIYRTASNRLNLGDDDILTFPSRSATSDVFVESAVSGDAFYRFQITANGTLQWGDGTATRDTNLYRSAANTLRTDDSLYVGGSLTVDGLTAANGSLDLGDTAADTITFVGVVDSDIIPSTSTTYDLGSSSRRWAEGFFDSVTANTLTGVVAGGSTTSSTWTINSDNASANAEVSGVAFETGTGNFNATLQWNASGDAGRISGFDDTLLSNYPIAIFSEVSGPNQSFTSGTLFSYGQNATHAITQSGAFTGIDVDFSSNITVPNSANGNQTGIALTLADGGASATAIGFSLAGTADYGINLSSATIGTAAISLPTGSAAAQGIDFGGDTNLYRSAANVLRTDDSLVIGTDLTISGTFDASSSSGSFDSLTIGGGYGSTGVTISNIGNIQADGTLTIGADVSLSRGAANRLDLASGDSLNIVNGNLFFGATSTGIQDGNGNEFVTFTVGSASALNYVDIQNAGNNTSVKWTATGDDTNITWDFRVKGTNAAASQFRWYAGEGSTQLAVLDAGGQLELPTVGSSAGILIGGDVQLYRGGANRLDIADGDSLFVRTGHIEFGTEASTFSGTGIKQTSGGYLVTQSDAGIVFTADANNNDTNAFRFYQDGTELSGSLIAEITSNGELALPTAGSGGGVVIGGDARIYRGAANRLDLASGDSLKLVSGSLGINVDPPTDAAFRADFTSTATSGNAWGGRLFVNASPSSASSASFYGAQIGTAGTATANITGAIHGARISNFSGAAGGVTITTAEALQLQAIQITTGATITNARGLNVQDLQVSGGSVVTHNYGIYVSNQTAGTNDYGIAIAGADTQALWVGSGADNTDAANGIAFGASRDTNLYRGAANFLATDDNFQARGGTLNAGIDGTTNGTINVFSGATSGSTLRIYLAENADTNLDYYSFLTSSGDETLYLNAGSSRAMSWTHTASAVNRINVTGGAAGNAPILSAAGLDTDINIQLTPKGTGDVVVSTGQLQLSEQGSSAGLLIGGDVQLYRSASDTLRLGTDDILDIRKNSVSSRVIQVGGASDANTRFNLWADGSMFWGNGTDGTDVQLSRGAANRLDLASGDSFNIVSGTLSIGTATFFQDSASSQRIRNTSAGFTDLRIGTFDSEAGIISLAAPGTGSDGGEARFYLNGDHDTNREYAYIQAQQDDLRIGYPTGPEVARFSYEGLLSIPTTGSSAGVLLGGDAQLYRGASNRVDLGAGDSLYVPEQFAVGSIAPQANRTALIGRDMSASSGSSMHQLWVRTNNLSLSGSYNQHVGVLAVGHASGTTVDFDISGTVGVFSNIYTYGHAINVAGGTVTNASSVYIASGMTGATNNYALFVDAGDTRLDGQLQLPTTGSSAGLLLGGDVQLYRGAADDLYLAAGDDLFVPGTVQGYARVASSANTGYFYSLGTSGSFALAASVIGDTNQRVIVTTNGEIRLGDGTNAADTILSRGAANRLDLASGDSFSIANGNLHFGTTSTGILDANSNEMLILSATSSAVNHIQIRNNATGLFPSLTAVGDDTNIGFDISSKGSGSIRFWANNSSTFLAQFNSSGKLQVTTTGSSGGIELGGDFHLYRLAADFGYTPDTLQVGGAFQVDGISYFPSTGAGGGLRIGGDTDLYRSAANVLATSDALAVSGVIQSGGTTMLAYNRIGTSDTANLAAAINSSDDLFISDSLELGTGGTINFQTFSTIVSNTGVCHIVTGSVYQLGDCNAAPTDLAENFATTDASIEAGDIVASTGQAQEVVVNGTPTSKAYVEKTAFAYQAEVIGVVSTAPNQLYGDDGLFDESENPRPVSLAGRVPVKVTTQNGAIKTGDAITSSNIPGVGMKATTAGRVIGIALGSYENEDSTEVGSVIVFVNTSWWSPTAGGLALEQEGQQEGTTPTVTTAISGLTTATIDGIQSFFFDGIVVARNAFAALFNVSNERIGSFATSFISSLVSGGDELIAESSKLKQEASADETGPVQITTYSLQSSSREIMISGTGMMRECAGYAAGSMTGCNAIAGMLGFSTSFGGDDVAGIVAFAPEFSALLDESVEVRVLITPTDEVSGTLYVAEKSIRGFVVAESVAQDVGITFDWIVVARIGDGTGAAQVEELFAQEEVIDPISNEGVDENGIPDEFYEEYPGGMVGSDEELQGGEEPIIEENSGGVPSEGEAAGGGEESAPDESSGATPLESSSEDQTGQAEPGNTTTP